MNSETEQIFLVNPSISQPSTSQAKVETEIPSTNQVNLENVADFSSVCRTCATITQFLIPIFSGEGLQNNLADKIQKHLPIQVTAQDQLPVAVCYQCAHTLLAWCELVACCRQADEALRTRLAQIHTHTQDLETVPTEEPKTVEEKEQQQFEEIVDFVVPMNPPEYPAPATKACDYCAMELEPLAYKEHLIASHSDLLFHCDNCDTYVDKRDFILHMSVHAVQFSKSKNKAEPKETDEKENNVENGQENENLDSETENSAPEEDLIPQPEVQVEINVETKDTEVVNVENNTQNEFSDHSDTEYGFGPLPESVFEAIEDSQDDQPVEEPLIPEIIEEIEEKPVSDVTNVEIPKDIKIKKHNRSRACPICGKVYTASSSYFYHMKYSHKLSKDQECSICGRKFISKSCLNQHMVIHSGKCDYECKYCGKKFKSNASLYIHEQSHNGVKLYSCNQCHLSFRWRTHLIRHMKRHSAVKNHVCATCGKGFAIHCDLLRHARTHNAGDFKCDKCGVKFAQLRYLKVHMDKKHSINDIK